MKLNGEIEISNYDKVVIDQTHVFVRDYETWVGVSHASSQMTRPDMARVVKSFVARPKQYKVCVSGYTINITRR